MRSLYVCLPALALFTLVSLDAAAQTVQGELTCDSCKTYNNVVVEVADSNRNPVGSFSVNHSGSFDMNGVRDGNYMLTVRGPNGDEITTQSVNVRANAGPVTIRLPESGNSQPAGAGRAVSLHQLSHKVPKAAKKEFAKAANAGDDHAAAIRHLEKAVTIDPQYMEALNNLGSRYIQVGRLDDAMAVLTKAEEVDPASSKVQSNIAVVYLTQRKIAEAERSARRAFQLGSEDPKARYVLALVLYNKQQFSDEMVGLMSGSVDKFPNANIALAYVYSTQGKTKEARSLLNGYLAAGHQERASQVRQMLATLK